MTIKEKSAIARRLREAREAARVTKEEAAAAAGAQASAITSWERGSALPNLIQLKGLLSCYGVTSHHVLFGVRLLELAEEESAELTALAQSGSARLRRKVDLILAVAGRTSSSQSVS